jgi:hypothetical protein
MTSPPSIRDLKLMGAVDARIIVPVQDAHGGVTIYYQGRPTHYLWAGEWYQAIPEPAGPGDAALSDAASHQPITRTD